MYCAVHSPMPGRARSWTIASSRLFRGPKICGSDATACASDDSAAARARDAGYVVVYNQALLLRTAIRRLQGDLSGAAALLDEFATRAREDIPAGHMAHDLIGRQRGQERAPGPVRLVPCPAGIDLCGGTIGVLDPERPPQGRDRACGVVVDVPRDHVFGRCVDLT